MRRKDRSLGVELKARKERALHVRIMSAASVYSNLKRNCEGISQVMQWVGHRVGLIEGQDLHVNTDDGVR